MRTCDVLGQALSPAVTSGEGSDSAPRGCPGHSPSRGAMYEGGTLTPPGLRGCPLLILKAAPPTALW